MDSKQNSEQNFKNIKFESFFADIYKERWPQIFESLKKPVKHILRNNNFIQNDITLGSNSRCEFLLNTNWSDGTSHTLKNGLNINYFYKMDPASLIVAQALKIQENEVVLDMCAAPGGKSLVLAEGLKSTGELISNELSNDRRERLIRVFQEYIPKDLRTNIFVKGLDGNKYGLHKPEYFDAILCDVPCSGERHLLENLAEYTLWTERRSQNLAVRQYSLLSSAWLACKKQGRIVYSTCSLSPYENDQVIKKIKKRRDVQIVRDEQLKQYPFIEETEYGYQILPDTLNNVFSFGPMYFSIMLKI